MATLPDHPAYGQRYHLTPDDGTEITYLPDGPGDDVPWDVALPGGAEGWRTSAEVEALPGGALTPVPAP